MMLFIMLYKMVLLSESVDKNLKCAATGVYLNGLTFGGM